MNSDRGTSTGPRTVRALLNVLVAVALVALGSVVSMPAATASNDGGRAAVSWPARWTAYTHVNGTAIGDVDGDVTPSSLDIASGACPTCPGPAHSVGWAADSSNAYFRIRLASDITDPTARGSLAEAFLVQIADASGKVKAVVGVERTDEQSSVYVADAAGDVVMKVSESALSGQDQSPFGARVVRAADGTDQFFLDFQVPLNLIAAVSGGAVKPSTPIKLYYGTSAAASPATYDHFASITADFMLGEATAVDFSTLATVGLAPLQHQVWFDSAGGSAVAFEAVSDGFAVVAPAAPTRTGHTFTGWSTAATGGEAYDFDTAVTGATTIYAQWTADTYQVTFESAGGSTVADQAVAHGDTIAVPADPTRDDDAFLGWFTSATGGTALRPVTQPVTAPTRLYAHWQVSDAKGVDQSPGEDAAPPAVDDAPADTPAEPGRQNDQDGAAAKGAIPADVTTPAAGGTPRNAPATTNPVVFYPNGGSAVDPQTVAEGDTATVPAEPNRAGYGFVGWFATADSKRKWDFAAPIDEATTLYAHWTPVQGGAADEPAAAAGTPDGDTNCADYATSTEATEAMGPGDPDGLDGDDDGTACEDSLPAGGSGDTGDGTGDEAGRDDGRDGGAALPNTGNEVPQALLPAAVMLLLLGFGLMTWDRRRSRGAVPGPA